MAELFLEETDWTQTRAIALDRNLFGYDKPSTTRRIAGELSLRLQTLTEKELEALMTGDAHTQRLLLWQAVC